jgi:toxin ParE1/3/4
MLSPSLLSPQAWQDALDIVRYIASDNPDASARFVPALEATCAQLVALPGMGSVRNFVQAELQGVRVFPVTGFEHYLIFYSTTRRHVRVLRILHAAHDFPTIFG